MQQCVLYMTMKVEKKKNYNNWAQQKKYLDVMMDDNNPYFYLISNGVTGLDEKGDAQNEGEGEQCIIGDQEPDKEEEEEEDNNNNYIWSVFVLIGEIEWNEFGLRDQD
ncbi:MAG: hypothetical protein EZS28_013633 [Streblomastix strix]|uniref:Uncharacterized protein n=1 Tax=Streblomastix strix TaxID=222440 RepID=A0A5J4W8M3_9EUKA|nr:MAG: hypothetical protein EZS28_013633 [Streblomastix strix]